MTDAATTLLTPGGPTEPTGGPLDAQAAVVAAASVSTGQHHSLSADQLASAKAHWIGQGLDPAAFDNAIGAPKEGRNEAGQFVPEPPEFAPSSYRPDYGPIAANIPTEELSKFHVTATTWASQVGLEPNLGQFLLEHVMQRARAFSKMTPAERTQADHVQRVEALRQCGGDTALLAERMKLAGQALNRADASFNNELLSRKAFGAWAITTLANSELMRNAKAKAKAAQ
jgi:hypothetical protein